MNARAEALAKMREPFREQAQKSMELYREFGGTAPDDAIETGINALWLQSVTDGSESYKTYLVSPLWRVITQDVLLRDGHMCAACRRDAEVLHHRSYRYEVMAGLDDERLISLCKPCHNYIHFHESKKIPKERWEKRLRDLQKLFIKKDKSANIKKVN